MATIAAAKLAITVDAAKKTARCVVTCQVYFTSYERSEMQQGLKFALNCSLWGADWPDPDDHLYTYGTKFFPDATPTSPENVALDVTVGVSLLDEDNGTDEVYGKLTLKNLYTGNKIKRKTNTITRQFG